MFMTTLMLALAVPLQADGADENTKSASAPLQLQDLEKSPPATEKEVETLLLKMYKLNLLPVEKLKELFPRLLKLSSGKIWILDYAIDYKQWTGEKFLEMLPKVEVATATEVHFRTKIAQEEIQHVKQLAKASDKSRQQQLGMANAARGQQISDNNFYQRRRVDAQMRFGGRR